MTNELIKIDYTTADRPTVLARDLHEMLEVETRYNDWFPRMCEYGFEEGKDFYSFLSKNPEGGRPKQEHQLTIAMAKELCMLQRSEKGKQCRQYLIAIEEAWNTPEQVMARALKIANKTIDSLKSDNTKLIEDNARMKPKEIFADAVSASETSLLVRDVAKLIRQNGAKIGEKRLYKWLRENGYVCQGSTAPTQKAMEMGLFEVVIRTVERGDKLPLETKTTKVTGKGQVYFVNKFLAQNGE